MNNEWIISLAFKLSALSSPYVSMYHLCSLQAGKKCSWRPTGPFYCIFHLWPYGIWKAIHTSFFTYIYIYISYFFVSSLPDPGEKTALFLLWWPDSKYRAVLCRLPQNVTLEWDTDWAETASLESTGLCSAQLETRVNRMWENKEFKSHYKVMRDIFKYQNPSHVL